MADTPQECYYETEKWRVRDFSEKNPQGIIYYYWTYDEKGKRIFRTTGKRDFTEAVRYCRTLQKKGQLYISSAFRFDMYTKDFFDYGSCPYIQSRLLRGYSYTQGWAQRQRSLLVKTIQPFFSTTDIRTVSSRSIDEFILKLKKDGTGTKTLNHILTVLKVIFGYAVRNGLIERNPAEGLRPFNTRTREKGIFSREELRKLFGTPESSGLWKNRTHLLINCIAATTGMRLGEILALKSEDITETGITVSHSWNRLDGLKGTKTGRTRTVPLKPELRKAIDTFTADKSPEGFIFSTNGGATPINHKTVYVHFWRALDNIGIGKAERERRNISFHSYRHTFNTLLLEAGLPPETVRLMTGHSPQMTAHYSHVQLGNMPEVTEVQELSCSQVFV
ncbi:site-specific integrase [Brucepastera parasyntrophica]|uniref:tyrosine-type recombinase/integrase n=1 Tax=Brucepastera parasyntrophica TaxID=2880008 RepID=UPI00210E688E|nr:site-specific integrase [Brucepastera parasyntrophica]ULQ60405.1 site-specific integrase [Brucepastera parasyntrophica]